MVLALHGLGISLQGFMGQTFHWPHGLNRTAWKLCGSSDIAIAIWTQQMNFYTNAGWKYITFLSEAGGHNEWGSCKQGCLVVWRGPGFVIAENVGSAISRASDGYSIKVRFDSAVPINCILKSDTQK